MDRIDKKNLTLGLQARLKAFLKIKIAALPRRHVLRLGEILGHLAFLIDVRHRRIVRRNLHFAHPQWPAQKVLNHSAAVFRNAGATMLEICQATCLSREDIMSRVRIKGRANLEKILANRKGAIIVSAHLGNWELAHLFFSCKIERPVYLVAQSQAGLIDARLNRLRTLLGSQIINKKGAYPKMAKAVREGNILALMIDQVTHLSEGVEVRFFNKTTTTTPAAAILALRYRCPVVPAFCIRDTSGELCLKVGPPLTLTRTGNLRQDIQVNTQRMTCAVEAAVRAHSEQWFWFHKRWKRHYPSLYKEDIARRKRKRIIRKKRTQKKGC